MTRKTTNFAMWSAAGIAVLCLLQSCHAAQEAKKNPLDPGTVQMLSNILESLDSFRDDRLRDLEKIRISAPNGTSVSRSGEAAPPRNSNSSVSEHIRALKEGIMGHNPVKKTFGYKVTVYTSPIGEDGKDTKPVLVTQYVGGDMVPDPPLRRSDEGEDLEESGNHPETQVVQSSESALLPFHSGSGSAVEAKDNRRGTEHSSASEQGHSKGQLVASKVAKGHDHEKHSAKHDEHHRESAKQSHRHDTQAHDKGGASQQGIRERTEIEYYEREHFLDTEYDKAKSGHDKTKGVKEHESHSDHDSHEDKRVHAKDDSHKEKSLAGGSVGKASAVQEGVLVDTHSGHYTPPLSPGHYHKQGHKDSVQEDSLKEDEGSSRLHHSEESKGHREHSAERDHQQEEKDQGYLDKDKGRRKEGYRERGYKITAEREYFLNDAHHDKGHASHTSGSKLAEQEGVASGSKEGERDRGFLKEEKRQEEHDAAYNAKEHKHSDGEAHSAKQAKEEHREETLPLAPPLVNYVEEHPTPHYPLPIVYAPSNDGAQAVLAYPPADLKPKTPKTPYQPKDPAQPLGGFDDENTGYVGHATYKKRAPSPLVAGIRDGVRQEVHAPPPSYAKTEEQTTEPPSSENSVRFPDGSGERKEGDERTYPRQAEKSYPAHPQKYHRDSSYKEKHEHPQKPYYPEKDLYSDELKRKRPEDAHPHVENNRYLEKGPYSEELKRKRPEDAHPHVENNRYFEKGPYSEELKQKRPEDAHPHVENNRYLEKGLYSEELKQKRPEDVHPDVSNIRHLEKGLYSEELKRKRPEDVHPHVGNIRHSDPRSLYLQGAQNADKLLRGAYPQVQSGTVPTVGQLIQEIVRYPQNQEAQQRFPRTQEPQGYTQPPNNNRELSYADLHRIYNQDHRQQQQQHQGSGQPIRGGRYDRLLHSPHQSGEVTLEQALKQQQQQLPRTISLEQIQQQQTKPPFSPVVLLSRGPPAQRQNQAVDVWYTRQRS